MIPDDSARELAQILLGPEVETNNVTLLQAVVASAADGKLSLYLSGDQAYPVGNIRYLSSYDPWPDDVVWCLKSGPDLLVLGPLSPSVSPAQKQWNSDWGFWTFKPTPTGTWYTSGTTLTTIIEWPDVPVIGGRRYQVEYVGNLEVTVPDAAFNVHLQAETTSIDVGRVNTAGYQPRYVSTGQYDAPATADVTFNMKAQRIAGASGILGPLAGPFSNLTIFDIGPTP